MQPHTLRDWLSLPLTTQAAAGPLSCPSPTSPSLRPFVPPRSKLVSRSLNPPVSAPLLQRSLCSFCFPEKAPCLLPLFSPVCLKNFIVSRVEHLALSTGPIALCVLPVGE